MRTQLAYVSFVAMSSTLRDRSHILGREGLPALIRDSFPHDIRTDAQALENRWSKGDFDSDLLRGLKFIYTFKDNKRSTWMGLDKDYPFAMSPAYFGDHPASESKSSIANGQWWPYQRCAVRDGVHGEVERGIFGTEGVGAYSIVMSHGYAADVDNGETIAYCGTMGKGPGKPTANTQKMVQSFE